MTKPELASKLQDWASKKKRANRLQAKRDADLQPHIDAYEKKAEEIIAAANKELEPVLSEMDALEKELTVAILALVKADGTTPMGQLESKAAIAQLNTDRRREIPVPAFMRAVPPSLRHTPAYFECLSVLVGKVDKLLDSRTVATIARPKLTHSVSLTLKSE